MLTLLFLSACCLMGGPDCEALHAQGGLRLELAVHPDGDASQVVPVLESRLEGLELPCARVSGQGSQVVVDIPAAPAEVDIKAVLGSPGVISFRPAVWGEEAQELHSALRLAGPPDPAIGMDDKGFVSTGVGGEQRLQGWLEGREQALPQGVIGLIEPADQHSPARLRLVREQGMVGPVLVDVQLNQGQWGPQVLGTFGSEDGERFAQLTGSIVDQALVVDLDGEVLMAPIVRERIPGHRFSIDMGSGDPDALDRAAELVTILVAGSLPSPVELISETVYGPADL